MTAHSVTKICVIDKCESEVLARGWCRKHYLRWYKHGSTSICKLYRNGQTKHYLYSTWTNMWDRCTRKNNRHYHRYGGRGIYVHQRWKSFQLFVRDMGDRPEGFSLDREDNDGNYDPDNCRWVDAITQGQNKSDFQLTYELKCEIRSFPMRAKNGRGIGFMVIDLAEMYGFHPATISKVINEKIAGVAK